MSTYTMITVKRLIIDDDLFGEIGGFKNSPKISRRRQIKTSQFLDTSSDGNCKLDYLPNWDF